MLNKLKQLKGVYIAVIAFVGFIAIFFVGQCFYRLYSLVSKNYIIHSADIYEIGTFQMQGRAYEYGASKNSSPRFEFTARNGYSFTIDHSIFQAIVDKPKLKDTLMYHDCQFKIFSDKQAFENYRKSTEPFHINVLQIQLGDKKYIDISNANQIQKRTLTRQVVTGIIFMFFIVLAIFKYDNLTEGEKALWGVIFLATMLGAYFLI
jgi:hypothetical protein